MPEEDAWPNCPNCSAPVAAHKRTGEPRKYCSDDCMSAYNTLCFELKVEAEGKALLEAFPWWPMCIHCGVKPRGVMSSQHYQYDRTRGAVAEVLAEARAAKDSGMSYQPPTLLWKFCSMTCRDEMLRPFFDADRLDDFRPVEVAP